MADQFRQQKYALGQRMRMWRAQFDLTQAQAAEEAQVSLSTWKRWESGKAPPGLRDWQRVMALTMGAPRSQRPPLLEWGP